MTAPNADAHERAFTGRGARLYETIRVPARGGAINLFDHLGYNLMASNCRIAYLVDDLSSVTAAGALNAYWWQRRAGKEDVIIDVAGRMLPAAEFPV